MLQYIRSAPHIIILFARLFVLRPIAVFVRSGPNYELWTLAPAYARRGHQLDKLILEALLCSALAVVLFQPFFVAQFAVCGIITIAFIARRLLAIRERRFEKKLEQEGYEHCLGCGYHLRGLPEAHLCPECGVEYELANVKHRWMRYLQRKKELGS